MKSGLVAAGKHGREATNSPNNDRWNKGKFFFTMRLKKAGRGCPQNY
jgi:hypothetical protein